MPVHGDPLHTRPPLVGVKFELGGTQLKYFRFLGAMGAAGRRAGALLRAGEPFVAETMGLLLTFCGATVGLAYRRDPSGTNGATAAPPSINGCVI